MASDKIPLNRSLPDFRNPSCLEVNYPRLLPSVTVVIAVHNEARSVLFRAIWSVWNRTPSELLDEIIVVEDYSDKTAWDLDGYAQEHWPYKVKVFRNDRREGVTRSRQIGAEKAQV